MILNYEGDIELLKGYKDMTSEFVGSYLSDETFFPRGQCSSLGINAHYVNSLFDHAAHMRKTTLFV